MDIYKRLKGGGLKTFTTFRTDGEAFYSTFLNKDGVIALSGNNMPPSKAEQDIDYKELLAHKIEINNLDEIIEQIIEQAILASKVGVTLSYDSLFFLVPENNITVPVDIDFIIGDFDIVTANYFKKNRSAYDSLGNLEVCIKKFLAKYAKKERETDYYFKVSEKLNPKLEDNQLFVKDGIKNIGDYSSEDGEVLKSNYID
ncbi:MAG: hypothetical protein U9Q12_02550, partial [Patescibacteria group bacterium]|nr:hypothetical protein [Patescibacteria group bacterium]